MGPPGTGESMHHRRDYNGHQKLPLRLRRSRSVHVKCDLFFIHTCKCGCVGYYFRDTIIGMDMHSLMSLRDLNHRYIVISVSYDGGVPCELIDSIE